MDRFSFLNAAHSQLIEDLYQQYLKFPDSLEPSWKAFFQGFDFALENYGDDDNTQFIQASANAAPQFNNRFLRQYPTEKFLSISRKEFKVVNLIEAYRTRGTPFTKTNPVRERRHYTPTFRHRKLRTF